MGAGRLRCARLLPGSGGLEGLHLGPGSRLVLEPEGVDLGVLLLALGHVVLGEDGGDGAGRLAGTAVDALVGVDIELAVYAFLVVDAVHWTDVDAGLVENVDARVDDDVRHGRVLPPWCWGSSERGYCRPDTSLREGV